MRDEIDRTREAALLLRPLPGIMADGSEPVRFGGKPRLPAALDWPRYAYNRDGTEPMHFLCEIHLARLPREVSLDEGPQATPDFPTQGSLFVFLPMSGDGLYQNDCVVLYTTDDVSTVAEREPPEDLADLSVDEGCRVLPDGTCDGGRLLVPLVAEALPFLSARAVNPLAVNMEEAAGADRSPWKSEHRTHEQEVERVLREARAMPRDPTLPQVSDEDRVASGEIRARMPDEFVKYNFDFSAHHLDWEFIWDFAKEFYRLCYCLTIDHFREMRDAGVSPRRVEKLIGKYKAKRKAHNKQHYGAGKKPVFWSFNAPVAVKESFDWQARRWMALSRFETGMPPPQMLDAFVEMLCEFERHYEEIDDEGYHIGARIGLLDNRVKGHDRHAGNTLVMAKRAFRYASECARERFATHFESLSQSVRWDSRVIQSSRYSYEPGFSLGTMPLQMFGLGFEIQSAVSDHADHVLLLQIGDSFGLPLDIGPDMIVQLWIKPDDLAAGRFDRVEMTMDMT